MDFSARIPVPMRELSPAELKGLSLSCAPCEEDFDLAKGFSHAKKSHDLYLCLYCLAPHALAKELMVHLNTQHRLRTQKFSSPTEFLARGGKSTDLLCVDCSRIFRSESLTDLMKFHAHECKKSTGICPRCGAILRLSILGAHIAACKPAPPPLPQLHQDKRALHDEPLLGPGGIVAPLRPRRSPKKITREDFMYESVSKRSYHQRNSIHLTSETEDGGEEKPEALTELEPLLKEEDPKKRLSLLLTELDESLEPAQGEPFTIVPSKDQEDVLKQMLARTSEYCVFCRQAGLISVDRRRLTLHLLTKHAFRLEDDSSWSAFRLALLTGVFEAEPVFTGGAGLGRSCECLLCGSPTEGQELLFPHWRRAHRGQSMECRMCDGKFLFAGALFAHVCLGTKMGADGDTARLRYACNICKLSVPGFFNLMVHLRRDHGVCELCLETVPTQTDLEHHVKKHKLHHFCWKCGLTYCAKPNFMTHLFWKHGTESLDCSVCLRKKWPHVYHFCLPPPQFTCAECGLSFVRPLSLRVHRRLHTGIGLRKCAQCPESFVSKRLLEKHMCGRHGPEAIREEIKPEQTLQQLDPAQLPQEVKEEVKEELGEPMEEEDLKDFRLLPNPFHKTDEELAYEKVKTEDEAPPPPPEPQVNQEPVELGLSNQVPKVEDEIDEEEKEPFSLAAVQGPNLSEDESDGSQDSESEKESPPTQASPSPPKQIDVPVPGEREPTPPIVNGLNDDLVLSSDGQDSPIRPLSPVDAKSPGDDGSLLRFDGFSEGGEEPVEFCPMSPLLPSLEDFTFSVPEIPTFEENSLPEHIVRENALFSLVHEHDYSAPGTAPAKFKNGVRAEKRRRSSSSSCPTDCSCSSSSSDEEERKDRRVPPIHIRKQKAHVAQKRKPPAPPKCPKPPREPKEPKEKPKRKVKKRLGRPPAVEKPLPPAPILVPESDLETEESGGEETFRHRQVMDPILSPSSMDEVWTMGSESFLLRILRGVKSLEELRPKKALSPKASSPLKSSVVKVPMKAQVKAAVKGTFKPLKSPLKTMFKNPSPPKLAALSPLKVAKGPVKVLSSVKAAKGPGKPLPPVKYTVKAEGPEARLKVRNVPIKPLMLRRDGDGVASVRPVGRPRVMGEKKKEVERLYCICQCPHDNVSQMIGCDAKGCEFQWFHFECVGILIPPKGKWFCPDCRQKRRERPRELPVPTQE